MGERLKNDKRGTAQEGDGSYAMNYKLHKLADCAGNNAASDMLGFFSAEQQGAGIEKV